MEHLSRPAGIALEAAGRSGAKAYGVEDAAIQAANPAADGLRHGDNKSCFVQNCETLPVGVCFGRGRGACAILHLQVAALSCGGRPRKFLDKRIRRLPIANLPKLRENVH